MCEKDRIFHTDDDDYENLTDVEKERVWRFREAIEDGLDKPEWATDDLYS